MGLCVLATEGVMSLIQCVNCEASSSAPCPDSVAVRAHSGSRWLSRLGEASSSSLAVVCDAGFPLALGKICQQSWNMKIEIYSPATYSNYCNFLRLLAVF